MAANADDLYLSYDENSNGGGDSSYYDAENSTNQRDNYEEELGPFILKNLFLYDSDDELTKNRAGADGALE